MINSSRRKFLQTTAFLATGALLTSGLLRQARQAGMKHFFLEQEEYAHSAFENVRFDCNYLAHLEY